MGARATPVRRVRACADGPRRAARAHDDRREAGAARLRVVHRAGGRRRVLDLAREPRWGRVEETYGESPYLASRLGVAYVRGVQGDLTHGVAATGKHFLGYAFSDGGLNHAPVHLGARELREVVAEPFRAAVAEAW